MCTNASQTLETNQLLKGMLVLDFSHRLPGPLGAHLLAKMGAEVVKVEDKSFKDPFVKGLFEQMDASCFDDWYQQLNKEKEVIRLDFSAPETVDKISSLVAKADGMIMSLPAKLQREFGLTSQQLAERQKPMAVIELAASRSGPSALHDVNALARAGLLSLYLAGKKERWIDPPFLPLAGISFGQQIARDFIACVYQAKNQNSVVQTTSYLMDSVVHSLSPFYSKELQQGARKKFLHNGAFPCYSIYPTKDGHFVALAAVEPKFWQNFQSLFHVELDLTDRFDRNEESFQKVADVISNLDLSEIEARIKDQELCLTPIPMKGD